ncbi:MAG: T9SS type A sorting domain-containing protein [Fidelibacterota bacterium]
MNPSANSLGFSLPKTTESGNLSELQIKLIEALGMIRDSLYTGAILLFNDIAVSGQNDPVVYPVISNLARTYDIIEDQEGLSKNLEKLYVEYSDELIGIVAGDFSVKLLTEKGRYETALDRSEAVINAYRKMGAYENIAWALFQQGLIYMEIQETEGLSKLSAGQAQKNFDEILLNYSGSEAAREVAELLAMENPAAEKNDIPLTYKFHSAYPNPFNPMTTIAYDLPEESRVTLIVYDIIVREVTRLVDTKAPADFYKAVWDGRNRYGHLVSSGVYIYRIKAGNYTKTSKMVFMR